MEFHAQGSIPGAGWTRDTSRLGEDDVSEGVLGSWRRTMTADSGIPLGTDSLDGAVNVGGAYPILGGVPPGEAAAVPLYSFRYPQPLPRPTASTLTSNPLTPEESGLSVVGALFALYLSVCPLLGHEGKYSNSDRVAPVRGRTGGGNEGVVALRGAVLGGGGGAGGETETSGHLGITKNLRGGNGRIDVAAAELLQVMIDLPSPYERPWA